MNDEQLIWEAYIHENFNLTDIKTLNRLLRRYYANSKIVLTNHNTISHKKTIGQDYGTKPKGLWYSLGNEWADFIENKMPEWSKDYVSAFVLDVDDSYILKIDSVKELKELEENHGDWEGISWWRVQNDLDYYGVEISPHQKNYSHVLNWYRYWDIASGCIWDTRCIKSITKIFPREKINDDLQTTQQDSPEKNMEVYINYNDEFWEQPNSTRIHPNKIGLARSTKSGRSQNYTVIDKQLFDNAVKQYDINFKEV